MPTVAQHLAGLRGGSSLLLVVDPLGMPWPADFLRLTLAELSVEVLTRETLPLEDCPVIVVGRPAAPSETELLARSSLLQADPAGAARDPEVRFWVSGSLPANALRRCDYVVEVQSPTRVYVHKNRWGTHSDVLECEPPEPASWTEPQPSP